jgi:hypothetical protein
MGSRLGVRGGAAVAIAVGWIHCASLSGLDQYTPCTACEQADVAVSTSSGGPSPSSDGQPGSDDTTIDDTGTPDVSELGDDDANIPVEPDAPSESGSGEEQPEAGGEVDSGRTTEGGGVRPDAAARDAGSDAATCNAASCPDGCCTSSGLCAGGGLTATCGSGGAACRNCAAYDLVCSAGACVTPVDSGMTGPPACSPSTCSNLCVPYFVQCCKSDQTCGCALLFPPGPCD